MMAANTMPEGIKAGVVGIGLAGCGIVVSLLASGHKVVAIAPTESDQADARHKIMALLDECGQTTGLANPVPWYLSRLIISKDFETLAGCGLVLECLTCKDESKIDIYKAITSAVPRTTIIASATAASLSSLQELMEGPERFLGIRYAKPPFATRALEINCCEYTNERYAQWLYYLAHLWDKEPVLLWQDVKTACIRRLVQAV